MGGCAGEKGTEKERNNKKNKEREKEKAEQNAEVSLVEVRQLLPSGVSGCEFMVS